MAPQSFLSVLTVLGDSGSAYGSKIVCNSLWVVWTFVGPTTNSVGQEILKLLFVYDFDNFGFQLGCALSHAPKPTLGWVAQWPSLSLNRLNRRINYVVSTIGDLIGSRENKYKRKTRKGCIYENWTNSLCVDSQQTREEEGGDDDWLTYGGDGSWLVAGHSYGLTSVFSSLQIDWNDGDDDVHYYLLNNSRMFSIFIEIFICKFV